MASRPPFSRPSRLPAWFRRRNHTAADAALAAVVLVALLVPLVYHAKEPCGCGTPPWWAYLLAVAEALPLVWRRRWPVAVGLASSAATIAYGIAPLPDPPVAFAALVAIYTVAAYSSRRVAFGYLVLSAVSVLLALPHANADVLDYSFLALTLGSAWLLGYAARTRRDYIAAVEARAAQLERTREMEREQSVAAERNRIARELHDIVAHSLSLMVVQAEAGPVSLDGSAPKAEQAFATIAEVGRHALADIRGLLGVLRTDDQPVLTPQPSLGLLPTLIEQFGKSGLVVDVKTNGEPRPLHGAADLTAYRVVQEALTNTLKHSGARHAAVKLSWLENALEIEVSDHGRGRNGSAHGSGRGLAGMRERIDLLGGEFRAVDAEAGGFVVRAVIPVAD